ncbi:MAG: hypothetical protein IJL66_06750 [Lachnospiraceae bacterium]|nr:hypothetical protein [Lachnospiraceae bacterium]
MTNFAKTAMEATDVIRQAMEQTATGSSAAAGSGAAGAGVVQADKASVQTVRMFVDGYCKKLELDLKTIQSGVDAVTQNWESDVSSRFATECAKKITAMRQENSTIDKNIKSFLDRFVEAYDSQEHFIQNAAELFK